MGIEIDLLANYPRTKRNVEDRGAEKTPEDRAIARQFGRDFFDGDRRHGYGGFNYMPRFWQPVVPDLIRHFRLAPGDSLLDVGCGKGFMLHDLKAALPGLRLAGIDISAYAIEHTIEDMRAQVQVADAAALPFADQSFDVVIAINTIHNLPRALCGQALREIQRVAKRGAFVTVDAWRNDAEQARMEAWNLTAQTMMSVEDWKSFFAANGYTGDYFWFIP
jgi:ubiquinone/menaquinone biosynthesis C-methylase UbiE